MGTRQEEGERERGYKERGELVREGIGEEQSE